MTTPQSSSSSTTAALPATPPSPAPDIESQNNNNNNHIPHWRLVLSPSHLTPAILSHPYPGNGTPSSPYIVDFLPGQSDPFNPMTYPNYKKWIITLLQAIATLAVTFASTAYSGGVFEIIKYFQVSPTIATLGISLFVFGFAIGPLLWAPLSEFYGRQPIFALTYMGLMVFCAGAAGADTMETLVVLRFFAGAFGSSPLTNSGGVVADMFDIHERGAAAGVFAMAPFLGPSIGPIVGGFVSESLGWRWIQGITAIFCGVLWLACVCYVPETYTPVLLHKRALALSARTGKTYTSKMDLLSTSTKSQKIKTTLTRPWVLLFREPIVLFTSIYLAIIYGTLYMLFAAFPIVYQLNRAWSPGTAGLAFIGLAVGMIFAVIYSMFDNKLRFTPLLSSGTATPESRLPPAIIGSVLLPIGLFWFAWTNGPETHWIVSIVASAVFGAGLVMVFLSLLTYMIDAYTVFAASVLAASSVLRSLFGAAFPLFGTYMYRDLGIHWASSVPAFLAVGCVPFPVLFWWFGGGMRRGCRYAREAEEILGRMRGGDERKGSEDGEETGRGEETTAVVVEGKEEIGR
ncbi:major facilitator superfamily domain-containing protein [Triangularia verruculosa]|uniref:Major facilitator superfamily domain-containing protein n=1 Tax=Triangularia verruculosa TaxID=2587418 RepID=A0AAN6XBJ2_9PEZI|nr:major facilitator superfamily domain-containing protein [Triangularia verruculosa]